MEKVISGTALRIRCISDEYSVDSKRTIQDKKIIQCGRRRLRPSTCKNMSWRLPPLRLRPRPTAKETRFITAIVPSDTKKGDSAPKSKKGAHRQPKMTGEYLEKPTCKSPNDHLLFWMSTSLSVIGTSPRNAGGSGSQKTDSHPLHSMW
ncbi:unnamed protein product [Spirodela intermedia]|uniref:Uncharacterized protein n=1 Tax=Spirodela intermedia TaxID=51605 RepID=A0A7I8KYB4_SPIIN|nr:unnamed protein product [Spirodela intermedia]